MKSQDHNRELVFVYGTLRKGASNHFRMAGAEPVGMATVRGWMYKIDWYPGVVLDEEGEWVVGEVYRVSPEALRQLDEFEGTGGEEGDEYRRVKVTVRYQRGSETEEVWMWEYRRSPAHRPLVGSGNWLRQELRNRPLFLWIAWLPVFCGLIGALILRLSKGSMGIGGGMAAYVLCSFLIGFSLMASAAAISLRRRERWSGLAWVAFVIGCLGGIGVLSLFL